MISAPSGSITASPEPSERESGAVAVSSTSLSQPVSSDPSRGESCWRRRGPRRAGSRSGPRSGLGLRPPRGLPHRARSSGGERRARASGAGGGSPSTIPIAPTTAAKTANKPQDHAVFRVHGSSRASFPARLLGPRLLGFGSAFGSGLASARRTFSASRMPLTKARGLLRGVLAHDLDGLVDDGRRRACRGARSARRRPGRMTLRSTAVIAVHRPILGAGLDQGRRAPRRARARRARGRGANSRVLFVEGGGSSNFYGGRLERRR